MTVEEPSEKFQGQDGIPEINSERVQSLVLHLFLLAIGWIVFGMLSVYEVLNETLPYPFNPGESYEGRLPEFAAIGAWLLVLIGLVLQGLINSFLNSEYRVRPEVVISAVLQVVCIAIVVTMTEINFHEIMEGF